MFLKQITAPTIEPISLTEAKLHLKVSVSTDDDLITRLIKAAREFCEEYTGRSFISTEWQLYMDTFPRVIHLDKTPIIELGWVKYYPDEANPELTELSAINYTSDIIGEPGRIMCADGYVWPDVRVALNSVIVNYTSGYGTAASDVPAMIKEAMLLHIGHNYDNRGDEGHRKYPRDIYDLLDKVRTF